MLTQHMLTQDLGNDPTLFDNPFLLDISEVATIPNLQVALPRSKEHDTVPAPAITAKLPTHRLSYTTLWSFGFRYQSLSFFTAQ